MPEIINQTEKNQNPAAPKPGDVYRSLPAKKKAPVLWRPVLILFVVIILIGLGFLTKVVLAVNSTNAESGEKVSLFDQIKHLVSNPDTQFKGNTDDRINILLIGNGGPGHPGSYLADTIILASIKPSTGEVATLSIPRDLYVEIPGYGWRKINNALAFGNESDYAGGGEAMLRDIVEKVTGLEIPYYARVDFVGFKKIVDDLEGVDVTIDNSFSDTEYPDYNYGYQFISFKKGTEHMNGERALQFVRSRHGNNGEGSDFARSARQQKVLLAIKNKFFSLNTFLNPNKIVSILNDIGDHNTINMEIWEIVKLGKIVQNTDSNKIISKNLETGAEGLLISSTTQDGAYILTPKSGDYAEIQSLAKNIFDVNLIQKENARIEIQNGTKEAGLATKTGDKLKGLDYNIVKIGNSSLATQQETTTIYDLSGGTKTNTLLGLKKTLNAKISSSLPGFMTNSDLTYDSLNAANGNAQANGEDIDILIIIGTDQVTNGQLSRH
ncbi:MAG: LCP family protein [Patescibacteria group bacterium]|jgi:LCP family protein required for cell wall assembly